MLTSTATDFLKARNLHSTDAPVKSMVSRMTNMAAMLDKLAACEELDDILKVFPKADKFQAMAAAVEARRLLAWLKDGNTVETFPSTLVCHQDGTANGIQHSAGILRNRETAAAVNCTAADWYTQPTDIYGVISSTAELKLSPLAASIVAAMGRDAGKPAVLVGAYGAGEATIIRAVSEEVGDEHGTEAGKAMLAAMKEKTPAILILTKFLKAKAKRHERMSEQAPISWTTFTGQTITQDYTQAAESIATTSRAASSIERVKTEYKAISALSPNFIHSIDGSHVDYVVTRADFDMITVHDSFGSHAANYFKTNTLLCEGYVAAHQYDHLGSICAGMGQKANIKLGDWDVTEALEARLMFS